MGGVSIFLNGYYDTRYLDFYRAELRDAAVSGNPVICADGGIRIFDALNSGADTTFRADVLIGDLDSLPVEPRRYVKHIVEKWVGQTDKDYTDGQLALDYALNEYGAQHIRIYGGLPRPDRYETDHFLGNLKLMRFGDERVGRSAPYRAEMRDPKQTIHYVRSEVRLQRSGAGLQRVSLIADLPGAVVERSENLRWELRAFHVDPARPNALRNEFVAGAPSAQLRLQDGSPPIYVIHNW